MADVVSFHKALVSSPLKNSACLGAALLFQGLGRSTALMHGSQGCTAFGKVFFVRHYREPIPLQTTAMDQVSSVMGGDENVLQALATICEKSTPSFIGLLTSSLVETQGSDIARLVKEFRQRHPEFKDIAVVPVNTPDFDGGFEQGYAAAMQALIRTQIPVSEQAGLRKKQVNVLVGAHLNAADLEFVRESIESFGLRALMIPNLEHSLDGHLEASDFSALTTGGLAKDDFALAGQSLATLVIGASLTTAADTLKNLTQVPDWRFDHLMGLDHVDAWLACLSELSKKEIPLSWRRQRAQLLDAMLDCHFILGKAKIAIASEADLVIAWQDLLLSIGAELVTAVVPQRCASLVKLKRDKVIVGDFSDLERDAAECGAHLLLGSSHALASAERLSVPLLRTGFPQHDWLGGFRSLSSGYRGSQLSLFALANLLSAQHVALPAYNSYLRPADVSVS
ncbi:nitrogenase iron-molybdenum cofactor biosynthesis protein NifN [Agaribacterium haliotis]|uniref:nitrogenase iron-molybdenum cofactor biosynthesis protein NifN n=1 Tax=Agaribacterium haliotis TaxID=2013869 RepID=UPI000BB56D08|nr:nitrogenase iron-molybdenum cofactor biosynthesis protein NifN [Agaribacterium haliotis]